MPTLLMALIKSAGRLLDRLRPGLSLEILVKLGNHHFQETFASTPFGKRMLFLPFCLRPQHCTAPVDRHLGMLCDGACTDCKLGQARQKALALGYQQVFIVPSSRMLPHLNLPPSSEFMKEKLKEHTPAAALGVVCAWHLRKRLIPATEVGRRGFQAAAGRFTALQGLLLQGKNCRQASVDWQALDRRLALEHSL